MRAKITDISPMKFSRNGDVCFQRLKFQLEDGSFAMTDIVSTYRNYRWWKPVIEKGVGTWLSNVFLKAGSKVKKVDADSQVCIIQEPLINGEPLL